MGISLFRRLSEAHPQAISMLQNQVISLIYWDWLMLVLGLYHFVLPRQFLMCSTECVEVLWNYQMP